MEELFKSVRGKKQPWYKRLFAKLKNEDFPSSKRRKICKIIKKQLGSAEPWLNIYGQYFPKAGRIFRVKPGTRYSLVPPGTMVFVTDSNIIVMSPKEGSAFEEEVHVQPLCSDGGINEKIGGPQRLRACDLEPLLSSEIDALQQASQKPNTEDILFDGEAVELSEDVIFTKEGSMVGAASSQKLPKGLRGIIDNPDIRKGSTLNEINFSYETRKIFEIPARVCFITRRRAYYLQKDIFRVPTGMHGDRYDVYLPNFRATVPFGRRQLKRRLFDKDMFNKVVMDDQTRKEILSLASADDSTLQQWGIHKTFLKGRGKIFLAFGPPGTGKTMTGEALAEWLGRPLYIADSSHLGGYDPQAFESALQAIIEKTERWNSVTLIDEAEGILTSRDAVSFGSARVEAVLRNLEKLGRGILWLTTNRPPDIDFAIDSRIRAKIHFPELDAEKRRKVWGLILPKDLPVSGLTESCLDQLAEIKINGREIRNAVINASERASYESLKTVPIKYILEAAETIRTNQKILDEAKGIGFIQKKK